MDPDLRIDIDRLLGRLADLAAIGAIEGTEGSSRLAFTDDDRDGRDLVVSWMRDLGLTVTVDGIGNVASHHRAKKRARNLAKREKIKHHVCIPVSPYTLIVGWPTQMSGQGVEEDGQGTSVGAAMAPKT